MSRVRVDSLCQSGRNAAGLPAALAILAAPAALAGPTGWAHHATGFQSNGAVIVQSLAGGSYSGTQNPTGAVAKANQSAATQAPTVIIQATGGQYIETIPYLVNSSTLPSCPAGYTSSFALTGVGNLANPIINAGGTRMLLKGIRTGSVGEIGQIAFFIDTFSATTLLVVTVSSQGKASPWAALICTR